MAKLICRMRLSSIMSMRFLSSMDSPVVLVLVAAVAVVVVDVDDDVLVCCLLDFFFCLSLY
jgi:hypothetical protein